MIMSTMPQKTRAWMIGTVARLLGTQATRANYNIASKMWKPPTTNTMIAANVIKPGRPVPEVRTAALLLVLSRTDGSANRSSLLLSALSLLFSAVPSALGILCSPANRHGANSTNHAASFPARARQFPLAYGHR